MSRTRTFNQFTRSVYTIVGLALVGLGLVGAVVPGMPTTVFLIMALVCFKRGSVRFESWLLNHPVFGPTLRDWDENRWISVRVKIIATASILGFSGFALFFIGKPVVKGIVASIAVIGALYVLTRRTKPALFPAVVESEPPSDLEPARAS